MATVTPVKIFASNEIVTPANLNALGTPTVALADGEVTTAKLATLTQQSLLPAGAIMPFARATAPSGWLIANGNVVPNGSGTVQGVTMDYTALYAAVGTSFGAAGTLPDLRGIFVRGSGSQTISGLTYNNAFAAKEADGIRDHSHAVRFSSVAAGAVNGGACLDGGGANTYFVSMSPGTAATETRPVNIALLYCIKA